MRKPRHNVILSVVPHLLEQKVRGLAGGVERSPSYALRVRGRSPSYALRVRGRSPSYALRVRGRLKLVTSKLVTSH